MERIDLAEMGDFRCLVSAWFEYDFVSLKSIFCFLIPINDLGGVVGGEGVTAIDTTEASPETFSVEYELLLLLVLPKNPRRGRRSRLIDDVFML